MKRLLPILLCLLLLWGCAAPVAEPAIPTEVPPSIPPATTEEPGLHDPQCGVEVLTAGALKAYPLNRVDSLGIRRFGADLLLFSSSGLHKISTSPMQITEEKLTNFILAPSDAAVQVGQNGVAYFDDSARQLVFLDTRLREVRRMDLPKALTGYPALSADRKNLYYFTSDALRALNLETGLDRLVKQMSFQSQMVEKLHCDDQVLEYSCMDSDGNWLQAFVDVTTGGLLYETPGWVTLHTEGSRYFATTSDGSYTEKLTGISDSDVMMFYIPHLDVTVFPILEHNAVVTLAEARDVWILDYYDLSDGSRPYSLTLPDGWIPRSIIADVTPESLWMLFSDPLDGEDVLCRWDLAESAIEDDTVYVGIRRTAENPDEYGLSQCREIASDISSNYGVQVLLWQDALEIQPWDYYMSGEYQVLPIRDALSDLETVLSHFPEGFWKEAASRMGDGTLRIGLVRGIHGVSDTGALDSAAGVQFWEEETGNAYLCVRIGYELEQTLYHELFHVLESRVYSTCSIYDSWNKLNPQDFTYDYNYFDYLTRDDTVLISGDTQAFIDYYSMSFPKEDRARIMEYASMPGNEDYFRSDIMQQKLRTLCLGIREAYGLTTVAEPFLWEQYLDTPIHANG